MSDKVLKICFTASSGGHLEQIILLKPLMEKYDGFLVTEKTTYSINTPFERVYYLDQINRREKLFVVKFIKDCAQSIKIFTIEKPDVVISTGVLATIPISILAKLLRKKLIFIESFAKISSPTLTGKLMYRFADVFYVQWESMLEFYPKALYLGGIY